MNQVPHLITFVALDCLFFAPQRELNKIVLSVVEFDHSRQPDIIQRIRKHAVLRSYIRAYSWTYRSVAVLETRTACACSHRSAVIRRTVEKVFDKHIEQATHRSLLGVRAMSTNPDASK
jgi:hypothetical protein